MKSYVETRTIDLGAIGEVDCYIAYQYYPGMPETCRMGLPEDYDPGSASEVVINTILYRGVHLTTLFDKEYISRLENEIRIECDEEEL